MIIRHWPAAVKAGQLGGLTGLVELTFAAWAKHGRGSSIERKQIKRIWPSTVKKFLRISRTDFLAFDTYHKTIKIKE